MKTFVIGDIHGRIEALKEVLKKSKFDYDNDKLIVLGDVCDGGYNTYEVVEELLKIKKLIFILGNHDEWFMNYNKTGEKVYEWVHQGGKATLDSYFNGLPITHCIFFENAKLYHIENEMLFVHGGFDPKLGIENTPKETLLWDRDLTNGAIIEPIEGFKKIFIGHTPTQSINPNYMEPVQINNLIMMDCGAGWTGRLAIMNVDTQQFWVSKQQKSN